jgi:hypothetical protein
LLWDSEQNNQRSADSECLPRPSSEADASSSKHQKGIDHRSPPRIVANVLPSRPRLKAAPNHRRWNGGHIIASLLGVLHHGWRRGDPQPLRLPLSANGDNALGLSLSIGVGNDAESLCARWHRTGLE